MPLLFLLSVLFTLSTKDKKMTEWYCSMLSLGEWVVGYAKATRHKLAAVISWPPSPNLEIATNLKADCNRKWSIIITFMLFIRFKHCTKTYLSVWPN